MTYSEQDILDVPDFLRRVQTFPNVSGWIYRGQANATWLLLPKAGRQEYFDPTWKEKHPKSPPQDLGRFKEWRDATAAYSMAIPTHNLGCLALAQHYGLATRLLDWSNNPLVALYFAAETHDEVNGVVCCYFNLNVVNETFTDLQKIPTGHTIYPPAF